MRRSVSEADTAWASGNANTGASARPARTCPENIDTSLAWGGTSTDASEDADPFNPSEVIPP